MIVRIPGRGLLAAGALLLAACAGESPARPVAAAVQAPAPTRPTLKTSTPEPGVRLERTEIVTPSGVYVFQTEIADDFEERRVGLMNRPALAEDRAMLFVFPGEPPQMHGFWMKNTLIPLDIIYLAADGRIVSIARNTVPLSETPVPTAAPASAVLEINGGLSDRLGIAPGDRVRHPALAGD